MLYLLSLPALKIRHMIKHSFGQWVFALRPWSIPASAMPIVVTLAYIFFKGSEINWIIGVWTLVGMILFHLAGKFICA